MNGRKIESGTAGFHGRTAVVSEFSLKPFKPIL
jgi:hypothetical protein